jgi:hypothetical protein
MFLGILVLLTGLTISAVAIYYSVAGLVAIFAAAAIPIIIMGSTLEIAKLVTAVWLHRYWNQAAWWLKTYLSIAVLVLMFITSMGIFGFLSKAHIDQTASATEGLAKIEQLDVQIKRQEDIIVEAELAVEQVETADTNRDAEIQAQIDKEQERIDSAYTRIQPAIDEQNVIVSKEEERLGGGLSLYREQLKEIDNNLARIEQYIQSDNVTALQALVGVKADGNLGPATRSAIDAYRTAQSAEKQRLGQLIAQESSNVTSPTIDAARAEVQRLRSLAEQEIANSNELINRLRQQLGKTDTDQIAVEVEKQNAIIDRAEQEITALTEQKFGLESEYRKLEAEVGPIKYLAEFVYGNSEDKDLLEEAVRWVIVLIIFVFDPLAVLLLIASQYTFEYNRSNNNRGERYRQQDNEIENDTIQSKEKEKNAVDSVPASFDTRAGQEGRDSTDRVALARQGEIDDRSMEENNTSEHASIRELVSEDNVSNDDVAESTVEQAQIQDDGFVRQIADSFVEKKDLDLESQEESSQERERRELYEAKEQDEAFVLGKTNWKEANPDKTLKHYKHLYIKGLIDHLPWEEQGQDDNYTAEEGYRQNGEQNDSTLFNRLKNR